jgi:hypothetical protein
LTINHQKQTLIDPVDWDTVLHWPQYQKLWGLEPICYSALAMAFSMTCLMLALILVELLSCLRLLLHMISAMTG